MNRRNFIKNTSKWILGILGMSYITKKFYDNTNEDIKQDDTKSQSTYENKIKPELKERKFVNYILENWNDKTKSLNINLNFEEFFYLRELKKKYSNIENKIKEYIEIIYIYEKIKYPYLTQIARNKIKNELNLYKSNKEILLEFIRNPKENIQNNTIYFAKMHKTLPQILINKAQEYNLNYEVLFIIALIENNFGGWEKSSSGALGPMQVKENTILFLEKKSYLKTNYLSQNENDKRWTQIIAGIVYIKYLIDLMKLNIDNNNLINDIDFCILLLTYNQGPDGILENFNSKYPAEGIRYVKKGKSILFYNWDYIIT